MSQHRRLRTPQDVKADFDRRGQTVTDWARKHGFSPQIVYDLLRGVSKGRRGKAHKAAVLLGLKEGVVE